MEEEGRVIRSRSINDKNVFLGGRGCRSVSRGRRRKGSAIFLRDGRSNSRLLAAPRHHVLLGQVSISFGLVTALAATTSQFVIHVTSHCRLVKRIVQLNTYVTQYFQFLFSLSNIPVLAAKNLTSP